MACGFCPLLEHMLEVYTDGQGKMGTWLVSHRRVVVLAQCPQLQIRPMRVRAVHKVASGAAGRLHREDGVGDRVDGLVEGELGRGLDALDRVPAATSMALSAL